MPVTTLGVDKVGQGFEWGSQEETVASVHGDSADASQEKALGNPCKAEDPDRRFERSRPTQSDAGHSLDAFGNPTMVRQSSLQAQVARPVNALGQFQGIDPALRIPARQAVKTPADAPNLAVGYGSLEQGIETRATIVYPQSGLLPGKDASFCLLEGDLSDHLHVRNTVIKRQLVARPARQRPAGNYGMMPA